MRTLTSKELGEKFTTMVESGGGGVEGRKKNAIESQNTFTHTHYSKNFFLRFLSSSTSAYYQANIGLTQFSFGKTQVKKHTTSIA